MQKADLHIHTKFSKGFQHESTISQVLHESVKKGLNTIAVTDHNNVTGGIKAQEMAIKEKLDINVIIGSEISTSQGHVIGLNLTEDIKKFLSVDETIDKIHGQGGIAIAAHPYYFLSSVHKSKKKFDGIEVEHPVIFHPLSSLITLEKGLYANIGSSDAHHYKLIGSCYTSYKKDLIKSIKQKKTIAIRSSIPTWTLLKSYSKILTAKVKRSIFQERL